MHKVHYIEIFKECNNPTFQIKESNFKLGMGRIFLIQRILNPTNNISL